MKRKWLSKDRRQMADYEKISPACAKKKKSVHVQMPVYVCAALAIHVFAWQHFKGSLY